MATVVGSYLPFSTRLLQVLPPSYYPILQNSLSNPVPSFSAFRLRKFFRRRLVAIWFLPRVLSERLETEGDWELNFEREMILTFWGNVLGW